MTQDNAPDAEQRRVPALVWVSTTYFVQGLPYTIVNKVAPVLYKNLGVANAEITFWVSWLSMLWALKALWSPLVDTISTKRRWVLAMQGAMGPTVALAAFALPTPYYFDATLALLLVVSILSATYDIAADGFYMLGLREAQQSALVGVRSTAWRAALVAGESGLVMLAGTLGHRMGMDRAWAITLGIAAAVFAAATVLHVFTLPVPAEDRPRPRDQNVGAEFGKVFAAFFTKPGIVPAVLFLLFYRFAENLMLSLVAPFMLDDVAKGGLGLTNEELGFAKGFLGVLALLTGGIVGGLAINRHGLKAWLWPMVAILHLPDAVFVYLSWVQPTSYPLICGLVAVEQFGYGFGFTAYMMFMMHFAAGEHKTAHYAIATGIMAMAVTLTSMWSGTLQEAIGYKWFFVVVIASTIPSALVAATVTIDPRFGRQAR